MRYNIYYNIIAVVVMLGLLLGSGLLLLSVSLGDGQV
jgi:hypothetical protein